MFSKRFLIEHVQSVVNNGVFGFNFFFFRLLDTHLLINKFYQTIKITLSTIFNTRICSRFEKFQCGIPC